jgi:hypothetical protein
MDSAEVLLPVAVLGGLAVFWYVVIKGITEYILKKKMIDKGYVNEEGKAIFSKNNSGDKFSALKWGLIAFFGGLSLVVIEFIPFGPESSLPYGVVILFVAAGFLIYYSIVKKENEKENE